MKKNILGLFIFLLTMPFLFGCSKGEKTEYSSSYEETVNAKEESSKSPETSEIDISYATQFKAERLEGGYIHISVMDGNEYIVVPSGMENKDFGIKNVTFIPKNCGKIYLAASSAADFFVRLSELDSLICCSTKAEDYTVKEMRAAIEKGDIEYVGKYSAPDYEALISGGCALAIESTMIYHTPKVKEQLEAGGIPVVVERSSYEDSPLGRLEWIKFYGLILGREEEAELFFEEQLSRVNSVIESLSKKESEKKTVAFFYVSANGYVNIRKPGDYICKMIEIAGGEYVPSRLLSESENALSTININWEDFYKEASQADILIYNATVNSGLKSIDDLIGLNPLFEDFKAVRENNVYCTSANMYQENSRAADMIEDMYAAIQKNESGDFIVRLGRS